MFRGDGISIGKRICYKIQMFPAILPEVRPICIIYRSHICKFIYSSKCICNPQINTHRAFSVMHGDAPVAPNFHCPHVRSRSLSQCPDGGKGQLCGILIRALVISLLRTAALQSVEQEGGMSLGEMSSAPARHLQTETHIGQKYRLMGWGKCNQSLEVPDPVSPLGTMAQHLPILHSQCLEGI